MKNIKSDEVWLFEIFFFVLLILSRLHESQRHSISWPLHPSRLYDLHYNPSPLESNTTTKTRRTNIQEVLNLKQIMQIISFFSQQWNEIYTGKKIWCLNSGGKNEILYSRSFFYNKRWNCENFFRRERRKIIREVLPRPITLNDRLKRRSMQRTDQKM